MLLTKASSPELSCSVCSEGADLHSEEHCFDGECGELHPGHIDEAGLVFTNQWTQCRSAKLPPTVAARQQPNQSEE